MPIYKEVFQLQNSKDVFHLQNNIYQLQNYTDFPVANKDMIKMQDYKDFPVAMSEIFSISPRSVEKIWMKNVKLQIIQHFRFPFSTNL